ncbi:uncharacterized protein PAE49_021741 [Odontesthes bonariensis]|uniref:uncharacterized protein LOC142369138 n=1 Tax=Odontesthes bonariensis TaxID=219752 RepID=UPI003F584E4F
MRLSRCLCFLVLAVLSVSRGQNVIPTPPPHIPPPEIPQSSTTLPPLNGTTKEAISPTTSTALSETTPSEDERHTNGLERKAENENTTAQVTNSKGTTAKGSRTKDEGVPVATHETTAVTSSKPVTTEGSTTSTWVTTEGSTTSTWGYVILVLIILAIITLCVILYLLRRATRTYSFDLQRPIPANRLNEPTGTFEQVYLDDLDQPFPKDIVITDDLSISPVANGTSLQTEEKGSIEENAPQEQPDTNDVETAPASNTSLSSDDDPADKTPDPLSGSMLFFDAAEEQQNENNNNPSVCSSDPFVEINLDEPAWCDQLLTSSQASSSVLPFS